MSYVDPENPNPEGFTMADAMAELIQQDKEISEHTAMHHPELVVDAARGMDEVAAALRMLTSIGLPDTPEMWEAVAAGVALGMQLPRTGDHAHDAAVAMATQMAVARRWAASQDTSDYDILSGIQEASQ